MMDAMDIQAVESKLNDVTVTAIPMNSSTSSNLAHHSQTQPYNFSTSGGGGSGGGGSSSASRYKSAHKSHLHQQQQQHHHYSQPQPAHQAYKPSGSGASSTSITSSGNHHQQQQYHHPSAYQSSLPSPSLPTSPHVSMVPVSQLSPLVADASSHHHHHQQQQQHMHGHTSTPSSSRIRSSNAVASASASASASSALHYPAPVTPPIQLSETSASMIAIAGGLGSLGVTTGSAAGTSGVSKYAQLLAVIEEMGRDIRPTYTGSRSSAERLKRGLVHARLLVRECLVETERSARQN